MEAIRRFFLGPKRESIIIQSEDWELLSKSNNNVAIKVHRLLSEDSGNFAFSPYSVSIGIAMLLSAAEGQAAAEMRSALRLESLSESIASIYPKYMLAVRCKVPLPNFLSYPANIMICKKELNLKHSFVKTMSDRFWFATLQSDIKSQNEETIKQANALISGCTNGKVSEVLQSLDPESTMVLLNAIYLKGTLEPFPKEKTGFGKFYQEGKAKEVQMMCKNGRFSVYNDESVDALQIPFSNIAAAILIVLPRVIDGLESLEASLTVSHLETILKNMTTKYVAVAIPRFRFEYAKSLIPCYRFLGIERIFEPGGGLSHATESPGAFLSEILHKVVVEIDGSSDGRTLEDEENQTNADHQFVVDHPFVFVIYNSKSNDILVMGRVSDP